MLDELELPGGPQALPEAAGWQPLPARGRVLFRLSHALGFALPVASAVAHAQNLVDCAVWSLIALAVQIGVYYAVRIPVPDLSRRIADGELAAAIWLGLASLAAGALNAASMTY